MALLFFFRRQRKKKIKLEIEYNQNLHSNKSANISHHSLSLDLFADRLWKYMRWYIKIFFFAFASLHLKNNNELE